MMYHLSYILTSNMGFRERGEITPPRVSWCFVEPQQGLGLSRHTFVVFTLKNDTVVFKSFVIFGST